MPTRSQFLRTLALAGAVPLVSSRTISAQTPVGEIRDIGTRLEPFADDFLIGELKGTTHRLHEPVPAGIALAFDKPWEGAFAGYVTVFHDGEKFRMYYRGLPVAGADGSDNEVTCTAESTDGVRWEKPELGLFDVKGTKRNNVVLAGMRPYSHNFAPFADTRPGVPAAERFKALAGTVESGLAAFVSPDGLRWRKLREEPVLRDGAFDSQNVGFWSSHEKCYVCYFRTWTGGGFNGFRTVSRATSKNFLTWSKPEPMDFGGTPPEHLYTNQTTQYPHAPHLYVALPMRFMPGRKVLTPEQAKALGVDPGYAGDCAECVFMTSRGGTTYKRTFMEGYIRPGSDPGNWASRAGMTACGIIETGTAEFSIYKQAHYAQPSAHLLRYTLRTDGFASVNAPYAGGELITRPLVHAGKRLVLNMSSSAAGSIRVEVTDSEGRPLEGRTLADCDEIIGDMVDRPVTWRGSGDMSMCAGKQVRLRFVMKDADLYALRFEA
jgi:hypothetical protein